MSKHALKEHKKEAVATVKKLIMQYKLSMGDLRGKAEAIRELKRVGKICSHFVG